MTRTILALALLIGNPQWLGVVGSKPANNVPLPVGRWLLNEGGAATSALDSSGNGNNGAWNGTQQCSGSYYTTGYVLNHAGCFRTNNDIFIGDPAALMITGSVTISAWIYPVSITGWTGLVEKRGGSGSYDFGMNFSSTAVQVFTSGASGVQSWTYSVPTSTWTHVCGVISSTPSELFINGVSQGTRGSGGGFTSTSNPLTIGAWSATGTTPNEPFNGYIEDVRIYNSAQSGLCPSIYAAGPGA